MNAQSQVRMSYSDYLVAEAASPLRHEFIAGEVFAMAGGTIEHGALSASMTTAISSALKAKPCRVFSADVRVHVASTDSSFYPDLSVVCGKLESPDVDPQALANPLVLVEVLSPTTEAYDRGAKASHYRRLASLREYVLVSQTEKRIEVQRLNANGVWELHFFGAGQQVELRSLDVSFSVDSVYANPLT